MEGDWARPVVHWELVARDREKQKAFYAELVSWAIGEGPIAQVPAGLGGPEPGPGGHLIQGDRPGFALYVQVRDLAESSAAAVALGAKVTLERLDIPGGVSLAMLEDPEGNPLALVQQ